MIPDHLIDKAWRAYVWSSNQQAIRNEMAYPVLRGPMPPPPDPRPSVRAALEAVAADIWEEGAESGWQATGEGWNGEYANGTTHDGAQSFRDAGNDTTNPYRASETA